MTKYIPMVIAFTMAVFFFTLSGCAQINQIRDAAKTAIQPVLDKLPDVEPTNVDAPPFDGPA